MRQLGILVVLLLAALAWTTAAQSVTLPDPAVEACEAAGDSQIERGIQPGGGPKAIDLGPTNCDKFWFRSDVIGNEHSGGPVTCFWALLRNHPEQCPPGS